MDKALRVISDKSVTSVLQASLYYYLIISQIASLEAPLNSLDLTKEAVLDNKTYAYPFHLASPL